MNIKITIDAPELAKAIEKLAEAMRGFPLPEPVPAVDGLIAGGEKATEAQEAERKAKHAETVAKAKAKKEAEAQAVEAEKEAKAKAKSEAEAKAKAKSEAEAKAKSEAEAKAKAEAELAAEQAKAETAATFENVPAISLEVVRGKLAEHASKGKPQQEQVRDAIVELGATKLTEVKAEDYGKLIELVGVPID